MSDRRFRTPPVDKTLIDQATESVESEADNLRQSFEETLEQVDSQQDKTESGSSKRGKAVEEIVSSYLVLGEGDNVQVWVPIEMEVVRSMYDDVDTVRFLGVTLNRGEEPIFDADRLAKADGSGQEIKARAFGDSIPSQYLPEGEKPRKVKHHTKLFEGKVSNVFDKGDGSWFIRCTNIMSRIINQRVDLTVGKEAKTKKVLQSLFKKSDISEEQYIINTDGSKFEREIQFDEDLIDITASNPFAEGIIRANYAHVTLSEALGKIARKTNNVWWVNRNNQIYFGPPAGNKIGPDENSEVQLSEYIIQSDAGKQTPPYRSVKVIGDGVVSQDGWATADVVSAEKLLKSYGMNPNVGGVAEGAEVKTPDTEGELQKPTFVFRSREIKTKEQANDAAANIMDELLNQTKGGNVTMVGRSYVKPHDKLNLPDRFGGGEYIVNKVTHKFNSTDGYVTSVECGGLSTKDKAFYERADQDVVKNIPEAEQITLGPVQTEPIEYSEDARTVSTTIGEQDVSAEVEKESRVQKEQGLKLSNGTYTYDFDERAFGETLLSGAQTTVDPFGIL